MPSDYVIDEALDRFDFDRAHHWIAAESYWGAGIPRDRFERACRNSLILGVYGQDGTMAAMARVVTDRATFAWICDVYVDAGHRGRGLGKRMMAYIDAHTDLQRLRRRHLATRDAHGLYAQFGYGPLSGVDRWMEKRDPDPYG